MTEPEPAAPTERADPFHGPDWAPSATAVEPGTAPPERRRRRISKRRQRRRRRLRIALLVAAGLVVIGAAWLVVTGLLARTQLEKVRAEVHQLRVQIDAGDLPAARATAADIGLHADRAHNLTTGPAWALAAGVPWAGDPADTVRTLTAQVDTLSTRVLPQLVDASRSIDPRTLRRPDGSFDLARIAAVAPALGRADRSMTHATAAVAASPTGTWLPPVNSARQDLLGQLTGLGKTLRSADLTARIAPAMLGADGTRRYFMAFQNNAEARGTGGIPGAFAIVKADRGKITFERFEPDDVLAATQVNLDFGPGYDQLFHDAGTMTMYGNSNLSPHFPYAARIWLAMWQKYSGEKLDGAFAVDPTVLSYLLAVTGPAKLHDGTQLTAGNVVPLSESTVYARYPAPADNVKRKQFLLDLARAASEQVLNSRPNLSLLLRAAGRAAGERRILAYSTDPRIEADLEQTSLSGALPTSPNPYVGLSIVNDAGNKLDYYLDRSLTWQRSGCGSTRDVTVTVRLTNNAPASGLSAYVDGRHDRHSYPVKPGDNRLDVSYYATAGAQLNSITLDGKPWTAGAGSMLGHPVYTADVELPRGTTRTLVLHLREPAGKGSPLVLRQPLVRPLHVRLDDARC